MTDPVRVESLGYKITLDDGTVIELTEDQAHQIRDQLENALGKLNGQAIPPQMWPLGTVTN